jgi:cytochrome c553
MRRVFRILGYVGLSLVAVALVAYAVLFAMSEVKLRRTYSVIPHPIRLPHDSASIAEGGRLARIHGCTTCHGAMAQGNILVEHWLVGRLEAPNLTKAVRKYSDAQLEGIIRQGVRPNGNSVMEMPSGMFAALTDEDLGAIISHLRSLPVREGHTRGVQFGTLAHVLFALGRLVPAAEEAQRASQLTKNYPAPNDANWTGAYLARTACTECHGLDLRGDPSGKPPDLKIAGSYSLDAFNHLMRTGKAPGEREIGLMSRVARGRFSHFTDAEIASLHRYLVARARH